MAGNSQRRGAVRKSSAKKGPKVGSGGQRRRGLEGRGPTPKAEDREYHAAHKRKKAAEARKKSAPNRTGGKQRRTGAATEVVSGRNSVLEALRAGIPVQSLLIASRIEADDRVKEILAIASGRSLAILEVSKGELDRVTDDSVHQGVAIQVPPHDYAELDDILDAAELAPPALIVALDGITDPRNLGAALRSGGAFGVHGVVVPQRRAAGVTASAWKVSAGAAARVPVARVTNLVRALQELRQAGCFVVGLDGQGDTEVGELGVATDPLVLVVGSEGKGLSRLVREQCDVIASIPISSTTESLNAGVATGIALYEVARLRRTP